MKPTFRTYYAKNSVWLLAFIIGSNLLFFTLYKVDRFDKQSAVIWFWITTGIFIVSIIGTMIEYRKKFK